MTRAAIYLRQSLDKTGEAVAVARQREDCLKLVQPKGRDPVDTWTTTRRLPTGTTAPNTSGCSPTSQTAP